MKKTFKKQFILLAVIAVMMLASLMSASAESRCPAATGGAHSSEFVEKVVYAPTCTQDGYSIMAYCTECEEIVVGAPYEDEVVEKTGHSYKVYYVKDAENGGYKRVRECQNPLCQRAENGLVALSNTKDIKTGYYLVEFENEYEAPEKTDPNHSTYYDAEYYDKNSDSTWLATAYLSEKYEADKAESVSAEASAPACEIIAEADGLKLYVKGGEKAPAYNGKLPAREKDSSYGAYGFVDWKKDGVSYKDTVITEDTTFYADFKGITEQTDVSYSFLNWDGEMLTARVRVPYGSSATYGDLNPPSRKSDERAWYTFDGWTIGKNGKTLYDDKTDEIKVYYDTAIYAHYTEHENNYTVKYVDVNGKAFEVNGTALKSENVTYGKDLSEDIKNLSLEIPRDKVYIYTYENQWTITHINGQETVAEYVVDPFAFNPQKTVYVYDEDGAKVAVTPSDNDEITIAPKYRKTPVRYTFKVKIVTNNFDSNDVYENGMTTSAILDKFAIQVTDANGQYVAHGQTDSKGEFYFSALYSDSLKVTASSTNNNKYYGETILVFRTLEEIKKYENIGITIAPSVTADWEEGIKGCNCFCHSVFGGIIVKIYNILYRLFNIRYVCCDDLFIVHGDVLAYTK